MGLFSRVRKDALLDNPIRAQIHAAIEAQPGIHALDLVRLVGKGNGTVEHHLRKLVTGDLVTKVQGTGYTCYFVKGSTDRRDMAAAPLLKSPVAQAVLDAARNRPGLPPSVLARELGVAPATISYHLRRLETAGLVRMQDGVRAVPAA
jgi:predicted transcriptional regulator